MSQLTTIFEKIKEDFFSREMKEKDAYNLIFSPFSTGFNYDDFLFLDSNMASEEVQKYYDELYEFSQIANTIPREDNFWAVSDHDDYLFKPYKNILDSLRLLDPETLTIDVLYDHPLFHRALDAISIDLRNTYKPFYDLRNKLTEEIKQLKSSLNDGNRSVVDLEIKLKEDNLNEVKNTWLTTGKKEETENKILDIIQDEFKRFMRKFIDVKGQMESLKRDHAGSGSSFYLTSCMPNNLFKGSDLEWKKIAINEQELTRLLQSADLEKYEEIMGTSELSKLEIESINFDLLFVDVTRAWFEDSILTSPYWDINILNKQEIEIPTVTSKLIFIRNVDIKLKSNSNQNRILLKQKVIQNLGPFIIDTAQVQEGKSLQLKSVNKSLNVDRTALFDVASKLKTKQNGQQNMRTLIGTKQNKFIKLAPILNRKQAVTTPAKPAVIKAFVMKPMILNTFLLSISCEFYFYDFDNNIPVNVETTDVKFKQNGKDITTTITKGSANKLSANLTMNGNFECEINAANYESLNFTFNTTPANPKDKIIKKSIRLTKIKEEAPEAFQLIGVISKRIGAFPNPIMGADYL